MSGIKSVVTMICLILIITGIFSILIPKNKMEKTIKFAISLFFLAGIVIPIVKGEFDFSIDYKDINITDYQVQVQAKTKNTITILTEKKLENDVKNILKNNGINYENVEMSIHILEDESIDITKFTVVLKEGENIQTTEQLIIEEVGIKPSIEIEE